MFFLFHPGDTGSPLFATFRGRKTIVGVAGKTIPCEPGYSITSRYGDPHATFITVRRSLLWILQTIERYTRCHCLEKSISKRIQTESRLFKDSA